MNVLIFGCGYLGKRVARVWTETGQTVFAVTRSLQTATAFPNLGIRPIVADVCDPATLRELPEVDLVLYSVGFDRNSGKTQEEVTCGGVQHVLAAMHAKCRQFLYVSSTSVYGQSAGEWVDEDSPCEPSQLGGQLNLSAERMVLDQFPSGQGRKANILRLAGIYGPERLLSRIDSLRANQPLAGSGESWLNLIHVDDAVQAIVACSKNAPPGSVYNVVDDRPVLRREYFEALAQHVRAPVPVFDAAQPRDRGSGGLNKRCSNSRLRRELGWSPQFPSFSEGLPNCFEQSSARTQ